MCHVVYKRRGPAACLVSVICQGKALPAGRFCGGSAVAKAMAGRRLEAQPKGLRQLWPGGRRTQPATRSASRRVKGGCGTRRKLPAHTFWSEVGRSQAGGQVFADPSSPTATPGQGERKPSPQPCSEAGGRTKAEGGGRSGCRPVAGWSRQGGGRTRPAGRRSLFSVFVLRLRRDTLHVGDASFEFADAELKAGDLLDPPKGRFTPIQAAR